MWAARRLFLRVSRAEGGPRGAASRRASRHTCPLLDRDMRRSYPRVRARPTTLLWINTFANRFGEAVRAEDMGPCSANALGLE